MTSLTPVLAQDKAAPRRPLGRLLLDGGFIDDGELASGLARQKATNRKLGRTLVALGVLDQDDLSAVLAIQNDTMRIDDALKLAAGTRRALGELLVATHRITEAQVEEALIEQRDTSRKLGDILVARGWITPVERDITLEFQSRQAGQGTTSDKLRLGNVLVASKQITRRQLADARKWQAVHGARLGDALIANGYASSGQIKKGLTLQSKLTTAALTAALALALAPLPRAAQASTTSLRVSARIAGFAKMRAEHQAPELTITQADVARGYVDVPGATRFSVTTNSLEGYVVEFQKFGDVFQSVHIDGIRGAHELGANGGSIADAPPPRQMTPYELSYRFVLRPEVRAGTYEWPLKVALMPR